MTLKDMWKFLLGEWAITITNFSVTVLCENNFSDFQNIYEAFLEISIQTCELIM